MRIAYLVHFRGGRETGIYRKVREHVTEWTRQGADVGLFVATDAVGLPDWTAIPETKHAEMLPARSVQTIVARERLASELRRWKPDVAYARHGLMYPGFLRVADQISTIIEVNSDDVPEFRLTSPVRFAYNRVSRALLLRRAAGFVFVTNELERSRNFRRFGKPSIVIANGISLDAFPFLEAPRNEQPTLLFLGHPGSPWHGIEHVGELARRHPAWRFEIVGPRRDEVPNAPANMQFHGLLRPPEYLPIASRADVAIGTLALYRNGMEEASPLKVREYLALGIPTIIGYRDTDFPDAVPFLLGIPNSPTGGTESDEVIRSFVSRSSGGRVPREAIQHLDIKAKEGRRLDFLRNVAALR